MTDTPKVNNDLPGVLDQLAALLAQVQPDQYGLPTPCPEFDVAALRDHIVGWLEFFAAAFEDPDGTGERPDATSVAAAVDPAEAADTVRAAAARISATLQAGLAQRQVCLFGSAMPGIVPVNMCLLEYLVHGRDLAVATGSDWEPPVGTVTAALTFAPSMLTDDFRGPDKSFGYQVEVPESASELDRLVAFTGRDPYWKPA